MKKETPQYTSMTINLSATSDFTSKQASQQDEKYKSWGG